MGKLKLFVDRISTRLVGVLLLPILATALMATAYAYRLHDEARSLASVRSDTEVIATLTALRTQLAIERTTTSGAVAVAEVEIETGMDIASMVDEHQLDMAGLMDETRSMVDQIIPQLPVQTTAGSIESTTLETLRELNLNRELIDADLADAEPLVERYNNYVAALDLWIEQVESNLEENTSGLRETDGALKTLNLLQTLNANADQDLRLLVPVLSSREAITNSDLDQLVGNRAIAAETIRELDKIMSPQLETAWERFQLETNDGVVANDRIIEAIRSADTDEEISIAALITIGADIGPVADRLEQLAQFQNLVGDALIAEAAADEARANDDFLRLVVLGVAFLALTILLTMIVARHLARSMRQLGDAAESLQTGEFDASSLPTSGPREVVDTARAFSAMTDTLRAVDAHATAIATGESPSEELLSEVPGHIGDSLRSSLHRVEDMAEQLRHDANHDALTGLANRPAAIERIETLLSEGSQTLITTMFIDLDRFKRINDTFGHHVGDALLTAAGYRLQHAAGEHRTVARLGGDEFLLVADDLADEDDAIELANLLAEELEEPFKIDDRLLRISSSIGIAQEKASGQTVGDILRNADMAAYEAKRHRSQSVVYSDDKLLEAAVENMKLEEELRGAWTRGEMSLYLQPLVNPDSGKPASAEALMRWIKPDGTFVSPAVFIPIAEETGMIVAIDEWMVNEAARQISSWERIGHPAGRLRIAVNISGQHFTEGNLLATVTEACARNEILASQLVIEVTESCAIGDIGHTVAVLEQLRELGVKISLDDFGTGYSSLSYLQQLPIDTVKIDRSFVKGLPFVDANAKIVELVATLSAVLDLAVVAEGVETSDQADCLEDLGVDILQGYYYAKPMAAAAFGSWVEELTADDPFTEAVPA